MECTLYLTDYCNFECTYCYEGNTKENEFISKDTLYKAIDFIVDNNTDEIIYLTFLGGEPLLNKRGLFNSIDYINENYPNHKFVYKITTNGVYLDKEVINFLKENNFIVSLSIDGDRYTHNLNRREKNGKDLYDEILKKLKLLLSIIPDANIRMTVTPNNIKFFYNNIKFLVGLGVDRIYTGINDSAVWSTDDVNELDKQMDLLDNYYLSEIAPSENKIINLYDFKIGTFLVRRTAKYCSAGSSSHIIINSRGEIYPCSLVTNNEEWKIGTVFTGIDSSKLYNTKRNHVLKESKCKNCEINFACPGGKCGFLNYNQTGVLNIPGSYMCSLWKMISKHNLHIIEELYVSNNSRLMKLYDYAIENKIEFSSFFYSIVNSSII